MAMAVATAKMTIADFEKIPPPREGWHELHHGEVVAAPPPKKHHTRLHWRLLRLLEKMVRESWVAVVELPFRPLPEHELWTADIGLVAKHRWEAAEDWLTGSPELVVEILSPSNTASEMLDRQMICTQGGCREFWVVDADRRAVHVWRSDGTTTAYTGNDEMPLAAFGGKPLAVAEVFA